MFYLKTVTINNNIKLKAESRIKTGPETSKIPSKSLKDTHLGTGKIFRAFSSELPLQGHPGLSCPKCIH